MVSMHRGPFDPSREELATLGNALGHKPEVLASGRGPHELCVATKDALGIYRSGRWTALGWHEIQRGGWNKAKQSLAWELIDGTTDSAYLTDPGQIPGVFMERVQASIIIQQRLDVPDYEGSILVAGRRNPTADGPLTWMVQPLGEVDLEDQSVREFVVNQTKRLKLEYEY